MSAHANTVTHSLAGLSAVQLRWLYYADSFLKRVPHEGGTYLSVTFPGQEWSYVMQWDRSGQRKPVITIWGKKKKKNTHKIAENCTSTLSPYHLPSPTHMLHFAFWLGPLRKPDESGSISVGTRILYRVSWGYTGPKLCVTPAVEKQRQDQ